MKKYLHFIAALTAILLWSASFVATKITYDSLGPMMVGFVRFLIAGLILLPICVFLKKSTIPRGADGKLVAISALLGITLYFAFENSGVALVGAATSSLIVASFPAITVLLEWLIFRAKPRPKTIIGVFIAFIGVAIITANESSFGLSANLFGILLLLFAGLVWAFYNFTIRKLNGRINSLTLSLYQSLYGALFFIPFVCIESMPIETLSPTAAFALVYLAIGCSILGYVLYNWGLEDLSASTAVSLMNLVPVFGLFFAWLILGESISLVQIIGCLVVVTGIALTSSRTNQ